MNGPAVPILLKNKGTWSLLKIRIILHQFSGGHTSNHVTREQVIRREFVVSVIGYADLSLGYEGLDLIQHHAHASKLPRTASGNNDRLPDPSSGEHRR